MYMLLPQIDKKIIFDLLFLMGVCVVFATPQIIHAQAANWNATDWTNYDTILIDAANVSDDLTDFPVLIRLADLSASFWSTTPSASTTVGTDIRVTTDDGSPVELPRELVVASSTLQTGELWFKANSISSTTNTTFRIYYNGTTTGDYATSSTYGAQNVWTNDYRAVWHFQEDPSVAGTGGIIDSTGNGYNGTDTGGMSSSSIDSTTPLGHGYSFGYGSGYFIDMGDPTDGGLDFLANEQYSLSAWAKSSDKTNIQYLVDKRGTNGYQLAFYQGTDKMTLRNDEGAANVDAVVNGAANAIFTGAWHYFVGGRTTDASFLYDNAVNHTTADATLANLSDTALFRVGANTAGTVSWSGSIDEVRLASTTRTQAWVDAEYLNQATTTDFYTVNPTASSIIIAGSLYSDEGATGITTGKTIKLAVGTSTVSIHSTTTDSGAPSFHFDIPAINLSIDTPIIAWVDGDSGTKASVFTRLASTTADITNLNLYKDHVIIRNERMGSLTTTAISTSDLAFYDASDDTDIQYNASTTLGASLTVNAGNELYVATNTVFAAAGSVVLQGNGGSGTDGSLELLPNAQFRMASGTLSIAGNLILASSSAFIAPAGGGYMTATTTGKTIAAPLSADYLNLGNLIFNGSGGGWAFTDHATTTNLTITAGSVTVASGKNLTVHGNYSNTGGTFTNNGTLVMGPSQGWNFNYIQHSAGPASVSSFESGTRGSAFSPDGTHFYVIGNGGAAEVNEFILSTPWDISTRTHSDVFNTDAQGANWNLAFAPDGYTMYAGTVNPGIVYTYSLSTAWDINTASYTNISYDTISYQGTLYGIIFRPDGQMMYTLSSSGGLICTYDLSDPWVVSNSSVTFNHCYSVVTEETDPNGFAIKPDGTELYVSGRTGDDVNVYSLSNPWQIATSTVTFQGALFSIAAQETAVRSINMKPDGTRMYVIGNTSNVNTYSLNEVGQTLSGTLSGSSALGNVSVRSASTTNFAANASTSNLTITNGTTSAPSQLSIAGNYTNNSIFKANTGKVFFSGTSQQIATGTMTGTSTFHNLTIANTSQNGTTSQSVVFGARASTTGTFTMVASTSVQFLANATNTFQNIDINGSSNVSEAWLRSSSNGTQWNLVVPGNATTTYANIKDSNVCSSSGGGLIATSSTNVGNNTCWTFVSPLVVGSSTISNHDDTQVPNAFDFRNKTDETLFAFKLTPESGSATVTDITITLSGATKIVTSDFSNIRLYQDINSDAAYDGGDIQVGGSGVMSLNGQAGSIVFGGDFGITTATNYIVVADWSAPVNGSYLTISLLTGGVTVTDSAGTQTIYGSVSSIQHSRNNKGGTTGVAPVGEAPPSGNGIVSGGGSGGGGGVDTNTGGGLIGNSVGFKWPTAHSGSWTNAANAYDNTDGTYATDSSGSVNSFTNHGFVVPGGNVIQGIEVKLEVSGTTAAGNIGVELSWDSGTSWTSSGNITPTLTTTDAVVSLGGPSDLWGRTWVVGEFSNANLAVRLTGNPSSNTVQVDAIQVRVYHQTSGGGGGGGGAI